MGAIAYSFVFTQILLYLFLFVWLDLAKEVTGILCQLHSKVMPVLIIERLKSENLEV